MANNSDFTSGSIFLFDVTSGLKFEKEKEAGK